MSSASPLKDSRQRVSLVLFDMDFFKNINDTYGHATGDWVLKNVSDAVKTQLRKTDMLGRLGGEEFGICLPKFTAEEVKAVAERCRAAIAAIDTSPSGFEFEITASFGIATRDIDGPLNFEETLCRHRYAHGRSGDTSGAQPYRDGRRGRFRRTQHLHAQLDSGHCQGIHLRAWLLH